MNFTDTIESHFDLNTSISKDEALEMYGIKHLPEIIFRLKERGHKFARKDGRYIVLSGDYTICPSCNKRFDQNVAKDELWHCPFCGETIDDLEWFVPDRQEWYDEMNRAYWRSR
jgi:ribosomal protein L37AE/L43A